MIRADWRYGSAIYDRTGKPVVDAGTELDRTGLHARVELSGGATGYARLGDTVGWLVLAISIAGLAARVLSSRGDAP